MSIKNYQIFCNHLEAAIIKFPALTIRVGTDKKKYLQGILDIPNEDSIIIGSYLIEIHFVERFPYRFPILLETGESIPNEIDWHKYTDGSCCITVEPDEIIKCKHGLTVLEFIEKYAFSFFANHVHRKLTGSYLNGEYSHGFPGLKQFYSHLLKTDDLSQWENYYRHCFLKRTIVSGRNDKCFCGSNCKFKNCHYKIFGSLQEIGPERFLKDLKNITFHEHFTSTLS